MSFFDGGFGGLVSGALGAVGGLIGGSKDRKHDRAMTENNEAFQREVYQNQIRWKAADAKKAGLHPLAVVGTGSYSASNPYTGGGTNMAGSLSSSLGKLGEGIGDAFTAYKNKDEIAKEAAYQDDIRELNKSEISSRIYMNNANALEATRRAMSYTVPMASGREVIPGQTDSPDMRATGRYMEKLNKYAWPVYPDGSKGDPIPSSEVSEAYENAPGVFAYTPYIDAMYDKWRSILSGKPIDGHYHDWRTNRWTTRKPSRNPLRFWD